MSDIQSAYNYKVVRQFTVMSVVWGVVGMLVGVIIAAQLVWPELNIGFLHFGRLRPLHTNAAIFALRVSAPYFWASSRAVSATRNVCSKRYGVSFSRAISSKLITVQPPVIYVSCYFFSYIRPNVFTVF